jgi:adenosylhomocysteine nucleosidase
MESAAAAEWSVREGIPFAAVRAVSDAQATRLAPELVDLLGGGRVSPTRLAATLVRRPGLVGQLVRLAGDSRLASCRLAAGLFDVLTGA